MKLHDEDDRGGKWQLMLVEHFWAGVHFICSWTTPAPHIKLPKRVKGHCVNKPVSEGLGSISICPCFAEYVFFSICVHCRRRFPSPLGACFFCLSLWSSDRFQHQGAVPSASDVARATELTRLARVRWARARKEKCVSLTSVHVKEEEWAQEVGCCSFLRLSLGRQWKNGQYTARHRCKGARWK